MTPTTVLHETYRVALHALSRPGIARDVPNAATPAEARNLLLAAAWDVDQTPPIFDGDPKPDVLAQLDRGTDEFPEAGHLALIMIDGESLTRARLSGPGVDGCIEVELPLSVASLVSRNKACAEWPLGIDLLLIGPGPRFTGLPRTTRVELTN